MSLSNIPQDFAQWFQNLTFIPVSSPNEAYQLYNQAITTFQRSSSSQIPSLQDFNHAIAIIASLLLLCPEAERCVFFSYSQSTSSSSSPYLSQPSSSSAAPAPAPSLELSFSSNHLAQIRSLYQWTEQQIESSVFRPDTIPPIESFPQAQRNTILVRMQSFFSQTAPLWIPISEPNHTKQMCYLISFAAMLLRTNYVHYSMLSPLQVKIAQCLQVVGNTLIFNIYSFTVQTLVRIDGMANDLVRYMLDAFRANHDRNTATSKNLAQKHTGAFTEWVTTHIVYGHVSFRSFLSAGATNTSHHSTNATNGGGNGGALQTVQRNEKRPVVVSDASSVVSQRIRNESSMFSASQYAHGHCIYSPALCDLFKYLLTDRFESSRLMARKAFAMYLILVRCLPQSLQKKEEKYFMSFRSSGSLLEKNTNEAEQACIQHMQAIERSVVQVRTLLRQFDDLHPPIAQHQSQPLFIQSNSIGARWFHAYYTIRESSIAFSLTKRLFQQEMSIHMFAQRFPTSFISLDQYVAEQSASLDQNISESSSNGMSSAAAAAAMVAANTSISSAGSSPGMSMPASGFDIFDMSGRSGGSELPGLPSPTVLSQHQSATTTATTTQQAMATKMTTPHHYLGNGPNTRLSLQFSPIPGKLQRHGENFDQNTHFANDDTYSSAYPLGNDTTIGSDRDRDDSNDTPHVFTLHANGWGSGGAAIAHNNDDLDGNKRSSSIFNLDQSMMQTMERLPVPSYTPTKTFSKHTAAVRNNPRHNENFLHTQRLCFDDDDDDDGNSHNAHDRDHGDNDDVDAENKLNYLDFTLNDTTFLCSSPTRDDHHAQAVSTQHNEHHLDVCLPLPSISTTMLQQQQQQQQQQSNSTKDQHSITNTYNHMNFDDDEYQDNDNSDQLSQSSHPLPLPFFTHGKSARNGATSQQQQQQQQQQQLPSPPLHSPFTSNLPSPTVPFESSISSSSRSTSRYLLTSPTVLPSPPNNKLVQTQPSTTPARVLQKHLSPKLMRSPEAQRVRKALQATVGAPAVRVQIHTTPLRTKALPATRVQVHPQQSSQPQRTLASRPITRQRQAVGSTTSSRIGTSTAAAVVDSLGTKTIRTAPSTATTRQTTPTASLSTRPLRVQQHPTASTTTQPPSLKSQSQTSQPPPPSNHGLPKRTLCHKPAVSAAHVVPSMTTKKLAAAPPQPHARHAPSQVYLVLSPNRKKRGNRLSQTATASPNPSHNLHDNNNDDDEQGAAAEEAEEEKKPVNVELSQDAFLALYSEKKALFRQQDDTYHRKRGQRQFYIQFSEWIDVLLSAQQQLAAILGRTTEWSGDTIAQEYRRVSDSFIPAIQLYDYWASFALHEPEVVEPARVAFARAFSPSSASSSKNSSDVAVLARADVPMHMIQAYGPFSLQKSPICQLIGIVLCDVWNRLEVLLHLELEKLTRENNFYDRSVSRHAQESLLLFIAQLSRPVFALTAEGNKSMVSNIDNGDKLQQQTTTTTSQQEEQQLALFKQKIQIHYIQHIFPILFSFCDDFIPETKLSAFQAIASFDGIFSPHSSSTSFHHIAAASAATPTSSSLTSNPYLQSISTNIAGSKLAAASNHSFFTSVTSSLPFQGFNSISPSGGSASVSSHLTTTFYSALIDALLNVPILTDNSIPALEQLYQPYEPLNTAQSIVHTSIWTPTMQHLTTSHLDMSLTLQELFLRVSSPHLLLAITASGPTTTTCDSGLSLTSSHALQTMTLRIVFAVLLNLHLQKISASFQKAVIRAAQQGVRSIGYDSARSNPLYVMNTSQSILIHIEQGISSLELRSVAVLALLRRMVPQCFVTAFEQLTQIAYTASASSSSSSLLIQIAQSYASTAQSAALLRDALFGGFCVINKYDQELLHKLNITVPNDHNNNNNNNNNHTQPQQFVSLHNPTQKIIPTMNTACLSVLGLVDSIQDQPLYGHQQQPQQQPHQQPQQQLQLQQPQQQVLQPQQQQPTSQVLPSAPPSFNQQSNSSSFTSLLSTSTTPSHRILTELIRVVPTLRLSFGDVIASSSDEVECTIAELQAIVQWLSRVTSPNSTSSTTTSTETTTLLTTIVDFLFVSLTDPKSYMNKSHHNNQHHYHHQEQQLQHEYPQELRKLVEKCISMLLMSPLLSSPSRICDLFLRVCPNTELFTSLLSWSIQQHSSTTTTTTTTRLQTVTRQLQYWSHLQAVSIPFDLNFVLEALVQVTQCLLRRQGPTRNNTNPSLPAQPITDNQELYQIQHMVSHDLAPYLELLSHIEKSLPSMQESSSVSRIETHAITTIASRSASLLLWSQHQNPLHSAALALLLDQSERQPEKQLSGDCLVESNNLYNNSESKHNSQHTSDTSSPSPSHLASEAQIASKQFSSPNQSTLNMLQSIASVTSMSNFCRKTTAATSLKPSEIATTAATTATNFETNHFSIDSQPESSKNNSSQPHAKAIKLIPRSTVVTGTTSSNQPPRRQPTSSLSSSTGSTAIGRPQRSYTTVPRSTVVSPSLTNHKPASGVVASVTSSSLNHNAPTQPPNQRQQMNTYQKFPYLTKATTEKQLFTKITATKDLSSSTKPENDKITVGLPPL